jgi:hypothetical protein
MDETYRMLGREHQADLERQAAKWRRAQELHATARPHSLWSALVQHRRTVKHNLKPAEVRVAHRVRMNRLLMLFQLQGEPPSERAPARPAHPESR